MAQRASSRASKQNSRLLDLPGEDVTGARKKARRKSAPSSSSASSAADATKEDAAAIREGAPLVERLTDALMEVHFSQDRSLRQVARKYAVNTKTLTKYLQAATSVLQSCSQRDRGRVLEAVIAHNKSSKANLGVHQRRFTPFQELLIVGMLWLFEDVSIPMTKQQIMFIIRNMMQERQAKNFVPGVAEESDNMDSWYNSFSRRHEEDVKLRRAFSKKDGVDMAGGVVSVRRWFEKLARMEQKLIEEGVLAPSGLQFHQMLNYSEMTIVPPNRPAQAPQPAAGNEEHSEGGSGEVQPNFPVPYGILTTGEGKVLSGHLYHLHPDAPITEAMAAQFELPPNAAERPKADLEKPIAEYDAISQRRRRQPHWLLSHSLPDQKPAEDMGTFISQLIEAVNAYRDEDPRCSHDTVFILTLESHHAVLFDEIEATKLLNACMEHKVFIVFIPIHLSLIIQPNNRGFYHYFNDVFGQVVLEDSAAAAAAATTASNGKKRRQEDATSRRSIKSAFMTALAIAAESNQSKALLRSGVMDTGLGPKHGTPGFLPMTRPAWYGGNPMQLLDLEASDPGAGLTSEEGDQVTASSSTAPDAATSGAASSSSSASAPAVSAAASAAVSATATPAALNPLQARVQAQIDAFRHAVKEAEEHLMRQRGRILTEAQQALNKVQLEYRETLRNLSATSTAQVPGGVEALFGVPAAPTESQDHDTKRRRLSKHKRLPLFDIFCSDRGVDVDEASDEELMQLSDEFSRLPRAQKQLLEQRLASPTSTARVLSDDERLAKLCRRASFKAFVAEATLQLPHNLPRPQLEGFAVIFERLNAATKARLMYRWRDNPLNIRPAHSQKDAKESPPSVAKVAAALTSAAASLTSLPTTIQEAGV